MSTIVYSGKDYEVLSHRLQIFDLVVVHEGDIIKIGKFNPETRLVDPNSWVEWSREAITHRVDKLHKMFNTRLKKGNEEKVRVVMVGKFMGAILFGNDSIGLSSFKNAYEKVGNVGDNSKIPMVVLSALDYLFSDSTNVGLAIYDSGACADGSDRTYFLDKNMRMVR